MTSAGGLIVTAGSIVLDNGRIVSTTNDAQANGGDIAVSAGVLAMDSGGVQANADSGTGGAITIDSDAVLASFAQMQIGGNDRVTLQFDGPNVIQAVAPNGVNGLSLIHI